MLAMVISEYKKALNEVINKPLMHTYTYASKERA